MALPAGTVLVKSFPFDSNPELVTDVNGYLSGDRSVDAWTMQRTFKQFFSDGVFGTPADALQIKKGASGLTVTIEPGMFIIEGGMGGILESDGPLTLTLDTGSAAGNVCYGVMLRYDNNADMRSLGIRIVKGTAGASPQPPEPDQTSANVMEYRLGYITVPNGATDLSGATVTNEKGLSVCPYAAPFEEIDVSEIIHDAQQGGYEALESLLAYFETYREAIDAALSDEEALYLQEQINELSGRIDTFVIDLGGEVDAETIVYEGTSNPLDPKKLRVAKFGLSKDYLTVELQTELGILDTSGWDFDTYYSTAQSLSGEQQETYISSIPDGAVNTWTSAQLKQMIDIVSDDSALVLIGKLSSSTVAGWSYSQISSLFGTDQPVEAAYIAKIPDSNVNSWAFDDIKSSFSAVNAANKEAMQAKVSNATISGWTAQQQIEMAQTGGSTFINRIVANFAISTCTWQQLDQFLTAVPSANRGGMVGKVKPDGTAPGVSYIIVGTDHDDLTAGGKAKATLMRQSFFATAAIGFLQTEACDDYAENTMYPALNADIKAVIKPVNKKFTYHLSTSLTNFKSETISVHCFEPSVREVGCTQYNAGSTYHPSFSSLIQSPADGSRYAYFSSSTAESKRESYGGDWWTRSQFTRGSDYEPYYIYLEGYADIATTNSEWNSGKGRIPMFCI